MKEINKGEKLVLDPTIEETLNVAHSRFSRFDCNGENHNTQNELPLSAGSQRKID